MNSPVAALLALLDLEPIEVNIFRGAVVEDGRPRVFGGQVAGQALVAAGRTVSRGRVHSLHSYFLRPGDPTLPILYEVDRIRDGRSFTTRRVVAIQHGEAIFNLQCSFHLDEDGLEHADTSLGVPGPESLDAPEPLEDNPVTPPGYPEPYGLEVRVVPPTEADDRQRFWLRYGAEIGDDAVLHAAMATFASDLFLVAAILAPHHRQAHDPGLLVASLDHCAWFHRPFRCDDWVLYASRSPIASGARGLADAELYDRRGERVATVVQEGLVRVRRDAVGH